MKALLLVGGEGRRLRPLITETPKSLLQIGGQTILDRTVLLLRQYGVLDITLAVRYLASKIESHMKSGFHPGIRTSWIKETAPLGTAGALSLVHGFRDTMLMMNGDIVTNINIAAMLEQHKSAGAVMTVASKVMYTDLSLGVLKIGKNNLVQGYLEKPRISHTFGIGIYLVEPQVKAYMDPGHYMDAPDLINRLIAAGETVAHFDHPGHWIDIGLPEDYARVQSIADELEVAMSQEAPAEQMQAAGLGTNGIA